MDPLTSAALIGGGASLVSGVFGAASAGRMNKRAVRFQREMWDKQGQRELDYWHMQNQYNLPVEQMKRLKDAGLNPNLVYGSGADAQSGPLKAGGAPSMPNQMSEAVDFSSIAQTAMATKQIQANINRTNAETDRIKQDTAIGQFELKAREEIGQGKITRALEAKTINLTNQDVKAIREFDHWLNTAIQTDSGDITVDQFGMAPQNSKFINDSVQIATKKAVEEYNNLRSGITLRNQQHAINELQKIILNAEAEFVKSLGSKTGAGYALQLLRILLKR